MATMEKEPRLSESHTAVEDGDRSSADGVQSLDSIIGRQTRVRRIFSYLQISFFALTYMSSWESMVSNLAVVFSNGGPRALSWGILVVFSGALCQSASLAEISAIQPIAGAQYHWSAALAPPKHRRLITWLQGWTTWFAWISVLAGTAQFTAYIIQGIAIANYPDYQPEPWHLTLLIFALLITPSLISTFTFWLVPWIELASGILHVVLFILFLAVLLSTTKDKHSAEFVFFEASSSAGWDNSYVSWNLGLLTAAWGFVGFDATVHMSEEVRRARHAVPRAMFWSIAINGVMAYGIVLAILFCMGDLDNVLSSSYPMLTILLNSTGSLKVATAMCCGLLVISFAANLGTLVSVSRLTWAWARDGALPKYFSFISPTYRVPTRAVWLPVSVTMLLALINIGSSAAFGAFIALSTMGIYSSYVIAIGCMLHARLFSDRVELAEWNLGRWGVPINAYAILYSLYVFVFLPFPASLPVTGSNMNYALPLYAFAVLFSVFSWWVWGRNKWPGVNKQVVEIVLADSDKRTKD